MRTRKLQQRCFGGANKFPATRASRVPATQNEAWGFWGTWRGRHGETEKTTRQAWTFAVLALTGAGFTPEQARKVLDARVGRHMADQVDGSALSVRSTVTKLAARPGWRREMEEAAAYEPDEQPKGGA